MNRRADHRMGRSRPIRFSIDRAVAPLALALILLSAHQGLRAHPGVEQALRYFDQQIEQSPRDQALHAQRGIVFSNDGQYEQAMADFMRAAETNGVTRNHPQPEILTSLIFGSLMSFLQSEKKREVLGRGSIQDPRFRAEFISAWLDLIWNGVGRTDVSQENTP